MISYIVSIERGGNLTAVGRLQGNNAADTCFYYLPEYMNDLDAMPLSVSLPLQDEPFSAKQTEVFFESLLPEGFTRRSVAHWMHSDENDYLKLLHGLGRECIGAVRISEEGEEQDASYKQISEQEIKALAAEGATKSAELVTKSHLSLAGASGKAGLYYDAEGRRWFLPGGSAPSTHIVKQSHVRLDSLVTNEQLSLLTAYRCGITVPRSFIINTGSGRDEEVLFATKRFDRVFRPGGKVVDGLPCPARLHQEDFAQALSIAPAEKYENKSDNPSGGHMKRMFDVLRKYSSDPITDQLRLWDIITFNYLLGNTDAHVKNFSLLYSPDLKAMRLAPAYDILSTTVYSQSTREMAFSIGGARSIDEVSLDSLRKAAREAGLGARMAMRRYETMAGKFKAALHKSARELNAAGFPMAADIEDRILKSGGISKIRKQAK